MAKTLTFLLAAILGSSAMAAPVPVRVSSMNQDIVINQTLYRALKASVGRVPQITLSGDTVSLVVQKDKLSCTQQGCTLEWDTVSPNYPRDTGEFNGALYTALNAWATADGASDPAVHRVLYPQTGSVQVTVSEAYGSQDEVACSALRGYTDCTVIVSDISDGTTAELQKLYATLQTAPSLMQEQTKALFATVRTSQYATPGKPALIESVHTLYTNLLEDGYQVAGYYAYAHPVVVDGQIVSDGIEITLTGAQNSQSGAYATQIAQAQSYVLSRPIPPRGQIRSR
jgi:hypothetical protein